MIETRKYFHVVCDTEGCGEWYERRFRNLGDRHKVFFIADIRRIGWECRHISQWFCPSCCKKSGL